MNLKMVKVNSQIMVIKLIILTLMRARQILMMVRQALIQTVDQTIKMRKVIMALLILQDQIQVLLTKM